MIISGLAPNISGLHITKSAIFPTSIDPMYLWIPCAIAGLIVTLEIYLLILKLSFPVPSSSGNGPNCFFILSAVWNVLIKTSPGLPIACESDDIIEKIPLS